MGTTGSAPAAPSKIDSTMPSNRSGHRALDQTKVDRIVKQYIDQGRTGAQALADRHNISRATLFNWVDAHDKAKAGEIETTVDKAEDLERLSKPVLAAEVRRLREEVRRLHRELAARTVERSSG